MQSRALDSKSLTQQLKNRQVWQAVVRGWRQVILEFADGTALIIEPCAQGLLARIESPSVDCVDLAAQFASGAGR